MVVTSLPSPIAWSRWIPKCFSKVLNINYTVKKSHNWNFLLPLPLWIRIFYTCKKPTTDIYTFTVGLNFARTTTLSPAKFLRNWIFGHHNLPLVTHSKFPVTGSSNPAKLTFKKNILACISSPSEFPHPFDPLLPGFLVCHPSGSCWFFQE